MKCLTLAKYWSDEAFNASSHRFIATVAQLWMSAQGRTAQRNEQEYKQQKLTCSKLSAVVAMANFQQRKTKKEFVDS
jgi:hypothetical protein